ncbi:MAG: ABC transporter permease subunit [Hyphomicrobiales bacterium]|nr:ABC transporter permease subunit [Hyphomicrobiales bacterium]MCP5002228.1 ABC transporter permease subunit [Hyphomicrobiales bacterium]
MLELGNAFGIAFSLLASFDSALLEIVGLSLKVSLIAVAVSCVLGILLAATICVYRFPGNRIVIVLLNALMGLPPVVVGLIVYLLLSRSGPLGVLGLLYTPFAMIVAQIILITPLVAALSLQVLEEVHRGFDEFFRSLSLSPFEKIRTLLWEARFGLTTVGLAGFGRAISEVGAVMIVGGNINHVTRIMTTAIALETSKGTLSLALALGIILIAISVAINTTVMAVRSLARNEAHA